MARNTHLYSSVMRKINADPWFLNLSHMGQWLWLRLLTGKHVTAVPGLWSASEQGLTADLDIGMRRLRTLFDELCDEPYSDGTRRLYFDRKAGVLWLPKNISQPCNQPDNEFVVRGWIPYLDTVTECQLKYIAIGEFRAWIEGHPGRFPNGVPEDFPTPREPIGRDRLVRPSRETVSADRLARPSSETVSTEAGDPPDAYAHARDAQAPGQARAQVQAQAPGQAHAQVQAQAPRQARAQARDFSDEFLTNEPKTPGPDVQIVETVTGGVSQQEQEQEQEQDPFPKDLTGCTPTPASASGGNEQKPVQSSDLTPAQRCERTFTHYRADPPTVALFEAWKAESGKINARMDQKWRELFDRLVYECVSIEEVIEVVKGAKLDPSGWATTKVHLDPAAILGSAGQREKYKAIARAASEEVAAARRRQQQRLFVEPEVPMTKEDRELAAKQAQAALEQFEASQGRPLAKASRKAERATSETLPVALIASVPDEPSEGERSAERARRAEAARAALAEFDDEQQPSEVKPALEA